MENFLSILKQRGYVQDCTDEAGIGNLPPKSTAYIGFDCTASSLHVGSLVQIMMLRWLQKCGHTPIILMGGGTTKVGDPSGKDETRKMLTPEQIEDNKRAIGSIFSRFLRFEGENAAIMVDNDEWLSSLGYIDFLRDYGRHFSINRMLSFESVKQRLTREQHLSFLEFNYMLLQAYDFVELYKRHNCRVQLGGSDQWGNIVNGVELARRLGMEELYGITSPLITTSSGAKMGKTANGAVWLDGSLCSPYDYRQFWRNTDDADVGRFLRLFTDLDEAEIARLEALEGVDINKAKEVLADEATAICHGAEKALAARNAAASFFGGGAAQASDMPTYELPEADFTSGMAVAQIYKETGLAASLGEARRLVRGGGAKINSIAITDEQLTLNPQTLKSFAKDDAPPEFVLSAGKKRHVIVKIS